MAPIDTAGKSGRERHALYAAASAEWGKMLSGEGYNCFDPVLAQGRYDGKRLARLYNDTEGDPANLGYEGLIARRREILEQLFYSVQGKNVEVEPPVRVDYGCNVSVEDFYANHGLLILDTTSVTIGRGTLFGPEVSIYAATHPVEVAPRRSGVESSLPVVIGRDCWVGGKSVILPGVTVGDGVTIAAGSVVNRDVPSNCVVAGIPARIVKRLEGFVEPSARKKDSDEVTKTDLKA